MRKFTHKEEIVKVITDYICDICDEVCVGAEFIELKADWGYHSKHDGENWEAHVCENCVHKHLSSLIKFNKERHEQWIR